MRNVLLLVTYRPTSERFCKLLQPWPLTPMRLYTAGVAPSASGDGSATVRSTTRRYWTNEEIDDLKRMDQNKVPLRSIAESLGRTVSSIRKRLVKIQRDVPLSTPQPRITHLARRWTAEETTRGARLKGEGHSSSHIAKLLNRTVDGVRQKLQNEARKEAQNLSKGHLTSQEWEVLQKMKKDGAKCCTIARSLNRDFRTVWSWMGRQHFERPKSPPYTAAEDQQLRNLVGKSTPWREIQRLMPHRTKMSLQKRYRYYLDPSASGPSASMIKLNPWTNDELETLNLLTKAGHKHSEIASRLKRSLPDVTSRIREEWGGERRQSAKWSSEELALLKSMRAEGNTYEIIAAAMGNRTVSACWAAYYRHS